jgi:hypothetical protein
MALTENKAEMPDPIWPVNCWLTSGKRGIDHFQEKTMLWTMFVILLVLWLLGLVSGYTVGGFIHILLVIAIAVALINIISGRRAV